MGTQIDTDQGRHPPFPPGSDKDLARDLLAAARRIRVLALGHPGHAAIIIALGDMVGAVAGMLGDGK